MKNKYDFIKILNSIEKRRAGHFFAGDLSMPVPESENAEVYPRAVFDIPISGRKRVRFGRDGILNEQIIKPGDILFSAPGVWKCPIWDLTHELFCLVITTEYLRFTYVDYRKADPECRRPICWNYYHTFRSPDPLIRDLLRNLITLTGEKPDSPAAILLARSIILLSKDFLENDQPRHAAGKADRTLELLMQYLSENFSTHVSRQDVSEHFHLNACYISRLFREHCGKSFSEVLREYRMEHAAYLLKEGDMLIDEVAMLCGYSSTQTFTTMFRLYYGLPPAQYRLNNRHR